MENPQIHELLTIGLVGLQNYKALRIFYAVPN